MSDFGKILEDKCMNFSVRIANLYHFLVEERREYKTADQLYRSATSIGANLAEAQCAISAKDFNAKMYISLKECNETLYWLTLLYRTGKLTEKQYKSIYADCEELKRLFVTITKKVATKMNEENS